METFEKTFKLPSAGVFGGPAEVTVRPMTTKEEKIIYTSRDGSFLEKIVKSCIVEPKDISMDLLHPNDISYLLYMIREMTFGPTYRQTTVCPNCGLKQEVIVDITEMTYEILDTNTIDEKLKVKLPICGDTLQLKLVSQGEFNEIDEVIKNRIILYTTKRLLGSTKGIEKIHIKDIIKLCHNNIGNKFLTPNKNIKILIKDKKIQFIAL